MTQKWEKSSSIKQTLTVHLLLTTLRRRLDPSQLCTIVTTTINHNSRINLDVNINIDWPVIGKIGCSFV